MNLCRAATLANTLEREGSYRVLLLDHQAPKPGLL